MSADRVVVHVPGDSDPRDFRRWLSQCLAAAARAHLDVVGVAQTWEGVDQSFAAGEADRAVVARAEHIPQSRVLIASEMADLGGYTPPRQRRPAIVSRAGGAR